MKYLMHTTTWISLDIMQSESNQLQKVTYYMIPFI